jgi:hypothetical protein
MYAPPQRHQGRFWIKPGKQPPKVPHAELHERKLLLTVGMDVSGVLFWSVLEENQTLTSERYRDFLNEFVTQWACEKGISHPIILHENSRPHKAALIRELMASKGWSILPQAPYSPDCNPCDFNCFGPLKLQIKGIRYGTMEELKNAIKGAIIVSSENGTFNGVTKLPEVWESIVNKGGDY